MIRIQRVTSIIPTFHHLQKLIIPPPPTKIPTLTRMVYWRCKPPLPDQDHHQPPLAPVFHPSPPPLLPPPRIEVRPSTTMTTAQLLTSPPPSSRPMTFTLVPSILSIPALSSQVSNLYTFPQYGCPGAVPTLGLVASQAHQISTNDRLIISILMGQVLSHHQVRTLARTSLALVSLPQPLMKLLNRATGPLTIPIPSPTLSPCRYLMDQRLVRRKTPSTLPKNPTLWRTSPRKAFPSPGPGLSMANPVPVMFVTLEVVQKAPASGGIVLRTTNLVRLDPPNKIPSSALLSSCLQLYLTNLSNVHHPMIK